MIACMNLLKSITNKTLRHTDNLLTILIQDGKVYFVARRNLSHHRHIIMEYSVDEAELVRVNVYAHKKTAVLEGEDAEIMITSMIGGESILVRLAASYQSYKKENNSLEYYVEGYSNLLQDGCMLVELTRQS